MARPSGPFSSDQPGTASCDPARILGHDPGRNFTALHRLDTGLRNLDAILISALLDCRWVIGGDVDRYRLPRRDRGPGRGDDRPRGRLPALAKACRRHPAMSALHAISAVVALGLLVYLVLALIKAEDL